MALKAKHSHLKVVMSIGGWTWGSTNTCPIFSKMASSPSSMATFVGQSVKFARTFGFDGISLDWEYPGFVPRGCAPADTKNFKTLMTNLRAAINADAKASGKVALTLSAAVPAGLPEIAAESPENVVDAVDYLNLMSYDYHGAWENVTGVNTPMVQEQDGDGMSITTTLQAYKSRGVPMSKLVLGMATYGRSWDISGATCLSPARASTSGAPACGILTPAAGGAGAAGSCTRQKGTLAYYEIVELLKQSGTVTGFNDTLVSPFAYAASGNPWVGYDNPASIKAKTQLVHKMGMAGAMAWSLDTDDFNNGYPLMNAMADTLLGTSCPSSCSNHGVCTASNECVCDEGWDGADCGTCTCSSGSGPVCSGHGSCHLNSTADACQCTCDKGWLGTDCSQSNTPSSCTSKSSVTPSKGYFTAAVSLTTASALQGWQVSWQWAQAGNTLSTCWGAPTGLHVEANATGVTITPTAAVDVPAGGTVSFTCGANGAGPGSPPAHIDLNGVACQ